ncbi:DUF2510 domain-containing protein [Cellulomonas soli]|uniref:DUF2510 domain-containing protein n=1 Tax=Cellulomonas soli TaxID=931535 RepID=A0A512PFE9_9CELL|nr:DUF2510 domain-containing protein [Cellulomonas soli]NYI59340.1 hypothetical protein [Cellulomonas soli]GEP69872.1 hypothetical protein CSO01_25870 [Cellulomonas soli]
MTKALPGWYADARRGTGERWFDGDRWTEVRRDSPAPPTGIALRRGLIVLAATFSLGIVAAGALATVLA